MIQERLRKEEQDRELRELEATAAALREPAPPSREGERGEAEGNKADDNPFRQALPFKLEGAGRSKVGCTPLRAQPRPRRDRFRGRPPL